MVQDWTETFLSLLAAANCVLLRRGLCIGLLGTWIEALVIAVGLGHVEFTMSAFAYHSTKPLYCK